MTFATPSWLTVNTLAALKRRRKGWLKVHLWLGLGLGLFLSIIGITGAVLVFASELDHALNPDLYKVHSPHGAGIKSLDELTKIGMSVAPRGWESGGVSLPRNADENYVFSYWVSEPTPAPEDGVSINIAVDPYTGEVVGRRVFYHAYNPLKHCFIGFFYKLHYSMLLDVKQFGSAGVVLVGLMGVLLIISALTGLILWWPLDGKWRRVLGIKRRASTVRFNHDLHQSLGFYSLLVLLAVLVSGIYFNLPDQFKWLVERFSPLTVESASVTHTAAVVTDTNTIDGLLASAEKDFPGGRLSYLTLPDPNTHRLTACYEDVPSLKLRVVDSRCLLIDSYAGHVLQVTDAASGTAGDTFMYWQWPLHSGQAFGWAGRILVMLSGLACPVLFVTGVIRWLQKRQAKTVMTERRSPLNL